MLKAEINNWEATEYKLFVRLVIQPFGLYTEWTRLKGKLPGKYAEEWQWRVGKGDQTYVAPFEVCSILNRLVAEHGVMSLFCFRYGILAEEEA